MNWNVILLVLGVACFVLDALGAPLRVNLFSLGWAFVVGSFLVGKL